MSKFLFPAAHLTSFFETFTLHSFNVSKLPTHPVPFYVILYQAVSSQDWDRFTFNSSSVSDKLCCKNWLHMPFLTESLYKSQNHGRHYGPDIIKNLQAYVWVRGTGRWGGGRVQSPLQTAARRRDKLHTESYRGISPLGRQYHDRSRQARWQSKEHYTETIFQDWKVARTRFFFSLYTFRANTAGRISSGLRSVP
jgi:hypothetical protein